MPTTYAIPNGATVMAATLYTGTGAALSVSNGGNNTTGVTFQPDLVWIKDRSSSSSNIWVDSVRGVSNVLVSSSTTGDQNLPSYVTALNANGFSVGTGSGGAQVDINQSGQSYVAWQWQAGQGTTSSNTNGSITSTTSVNATAGFSVVTYTGTGANATVGHGLGVAPKMVIVKRRDSANDWAVWQTSIASNKYLLLDTTAATGTDANIWNNTLPSSTVFSVGVTSNITNASGGTYVAYCWAEVAGYSKFGSYTGNGSTDGPFVYTGFRPAFIMIKNISSGTNDWAVFCDSMMPYNVGTNGLKPNTSSAEYSGYNYRDFLSNGFKFRNGDSDTNANGSTYIYAAFAENPFKYANAR